MQLGVAADFVLLVVEADGTEVFGQAFVEPCLDRRIVVVEQQVGEVVGDGAPGFLLNRFSTMKFWSSPGRKKPGTSMGWPWRSGAVW